PAASARGNPPAGGSGLRRAQWPVQGNQPETGQYPSPDPGSGVTGARRYPGRYQSVAHPSEEAQCAQCWQIVPGGLRLMVDHARQLSRGAEQMGIALSEHQAEQLLAYMALLNKWNKAYNLTAVRDPNEMVSRHLLDSLSV